MVDPEILVEVPMFQTLPQSERKRLAELMHEVNLAPGRILFEVGDPGSSMYIISTGKIRISIPGDSGEEMALATLGPGDFFGELALLDQNPRSARATAVDEALLCSLEREDFLNFVGSRPDAALAMLSATAKRLRHTDELMRSRASFDVNEEFRRHETRSGRLADRIARYAGSWTFIGIYLAFVALWIGFNLWLRSQRGAGIDTEAYEFLGLILGVVAAFQAPIIMMSQNRDQLRDRIRADADFKVNLKNEVAIEKALERLDEMRRAIPELKRQVKEHETVVKKANETLKRAILARGGASAAALDEIPGAGSDEDGEIVVGEGTAIYMPSEQGEGRVPGASTAKRIPTGPTSGSGRTAALGESSGSGRAAAVGSPHGAPGAAGFALQPMASPAVGAPYDPGAMAPPAASTDGVAPASPPEPMSPQAFPSEPLAAGHEPTGSGTESMAAPTTSHLPGAGLTRARAPHAQAPPSYSTPVLSRRPPVVVGRGDGRALETEAPTPDPDRPSGERAGAAPEPPTPVPSNGGGVPGEDTDKGPLPDGVANELGAGSAR